MEPTQMINANTVDECKKFISETLVDASKPGNFVHGIDINKLSTIYNNIDLSNAEELYRLARDLVSTQVKNSRHQFDLECWRMSGYIIIGGTFIASVGTGLSYFYKNSNFFQNMTYLGGGIVFFGVAMAFSVGH